jgi:hypothetical protein
MNKLAAHSINAFRTAQELSSSEPAQLRRTISDLEARIEEQDTLIALQNEGLQNLASNLEDRERELQEIKKLGNKNEHWPDISTLPSGLLQSLEQEKLARANRSMEALIEDFQEGFWTLSSEQRQGLEECLAALEQLPATAETRSLYSRVKRQWKAIESAKKRNGITPVNALRQLADLERGVVTFILGRPKLSLTTVESFRAGVLQEAFETDRRLKSLSTNESMRCISAKEERRIYREQALRAMRRAASLFPDKVRFEKKGRAARLIRAGEELGRNAALRCIITVCYIHCYCHNLLQSFGEQPEEVICTLGGIFREIIAF